MSADNYNLIQRIIVFCATHRFSTLLVIGLVLAGAAWTMSRMPLDALPDLSDTQVIIYSRFDRSPDIVEDQVTYPIITALLGAPKVRAIRGFSDFGYSYVYVIFEDGTDLYWARSRVVEYLSRITPSLPEGVRTELGPDATSLGWVYQYALVDKSGRLDLAELRSLQDWFLRYQLQSVHGVAEVASLGGFVKQYQVNVNPNALIGYNIPLTAAIEAVQNANLETGGRLLEIAGREYMIRGRGYIRSTRDLENAAVGVDPKTGTPITLGQIATVSLGPELRRGVADLNGMGDAPGGIVIMRHGENALGVIRAVKAKLEELKASLPEGVEIVPTYDRSGLIERSIDTLKSALLEEMFVVSLVILFFLWHFPSATTAIITIPISVFIAFIPLYFLDVTSNIMSLAGIAISIGVLVDGAIVQVENLYHRVQEWLESDRSESFESVRLRALTEVGSSIFFSLLVIAVAFIPVFTLVDQEGRLFRPLAYSKNLAMAIAAVLAITLDPAVRMLYTRYAPYEFEPRWLCAITNQLFVGRYFPEDRHPVSRFLHRLYEPACRYMLERPRAVVACAGATLLVTVPVFFRLGEEFMPPLNEGAVLYMPTTLPGISITEAERMLQVQDRILKSFPEVATVHGKAGRAETSTDPAPFSMIETTVMLKPESEWRTRERWYSPLPDFLEWPFQRIWPTRISYDELVEEMDRAMQFPGWANAWTMPIQNRVNMLATGIRTPIGIKISGPDLQQIEALGKQVETILKATPGTRSVYAERVAGGYFIDFVLRREELARYGLSVADAQRIVTSAIGGENISTAFEGRERYPINLRYGREFRDSISALQRTLVPTPSGAHVPIHHLAEIRLTTGPSMIRNENGRLTGYVYIDVSGRDHGGYIADAKTALREKLSLPAGYSLEWSGQYENMQRVRERMVLILPLTLLAITVLMYWNTKSLVKTGFILFATPFSIVGAIWFLWLLDYNLSIAVWVGIIALLGLDAETGAFMLLFLDLSYEDARSRGQLGTLAGLRDAVVHGSVKRLRPKIMTVLSGIVGLIPIMWADGTGSDVMKRIAAPMIGGLVTSFMLELFVYPALYALWKERELRRAGVLS